jgi:hypothetical protein
MAAGHIIDGLIKWARREEWRDEFDAVFDRHVGAACRQVGVEPDELAEIIGDHWVMTLWGCAFEDLVSSRSGERNIADDYLKRRGWKESAGTRAYITALSRSIMSLHEVSDIVPGEGFLLRDLVRGGDPVRVSERSASRSLAQWDRIAARVITVLGKAQIAGGLLPFSHQLAEEALSSIERIGANARKKIAKFARSTGHDPNDRAIRRATDIDEILASAAFMFSNLWLDDALRRSLNPVLPQIQNTDGDPLEFITLHFPLIPGSSRASIIAALDGPPGMRKENDSFWNWVEGKTPRRKQAKKKAANVQVFRTTMDDGAIVLGNIELTAKEVTLSVNSEARAKRGQALLEPVLAGLVRAPLVERQTVEQMMASRKPRAERDSLDLSPNEKRTIVHQSLTDHYRRTLDEPIPSFDNESPREAVKTAKGRQKVIAWLKMLENHSARQGPDDPMGSYDFAWMWEELGLAAER